MFASLDLRIKRTELFGAAGDAVLAEIAKRKVCLPSTLLASAALSCSQWFLLLFQIVCASWAPSQVEQCSGNLQRDVCALFQGQAWWVALFHLPDTASIRV